MARLDPHSFADDSQAKTRALTWRAKVDFKARTLEALAILSLEAPKAGPFDLDTRGLSIDEVTDGATPLAFELAEADPVLGQRLRVQLGETTGEVHVRYRTSPEASALQWLEPAQTAGGKKPYLFSQCQAIHARSIVPLQDTPAVRITWRAELDVPASLKAVMAAAEKGRRVEGDRAVESFEMPQSIPPYLFAFAVGDLVSRELGPRTRVWAEPSVVEAAAWEFAEVDRMILAAEKLFGVYPWERFDILTMPPSFPYGGMENPRLTFVTPTLLAGDRSQVNVIAHELAHSWTGNLISNANAEHFWLNEGFTVFAERKILEALEGSELTELHAALGRKALEESLARFEKRPELTKLRTHLTGVDPDDAFSSIPYEKGYLLLRALEEHVGREPFAAFVHAYVERFSFGTLTTEGFTAFCEERLPRALAAVNAEAYLHAPGLPESAPRAHSTRLEKVEAVAHRLVTTDDTREWTSIEWQLYLEGLPPSTSVETLRALDERFNLTQQNNAEVLVAWLTLALEAGHLEVLPRVGEFLRTVGRMKFLRPLYKSLAKRPETRQRALEWLERDGPGMHPISRAGVLRTLGEATR